VVGKIYSTPICRDIRKTTRRRRKRSTVREEVSEKCRGTKNPSLNKKKNREPERKKRPFHFKRAIKDLSAPPLQSRGKEVDYRTGSYCLLETQEDW